LTIAAGRCDTRPVKTVLAVLVAFAPAQPQGMAQVRLHNKAAMKRYELGDLEGAYTEFVAAYAALPDARDRDARESAMGSVRSVLLQLHARNPQEPGALCRLEKHLRAHVEALRAAHPEKPKLLELVGNERRLADVTRQLGPFGVDACAPAAESSRKVAAAAGSPNVAGTDGAAAPAASTAPPEPAPVASTAAVPEPPIASTRPPPRLEISPRGRRLRGAGWAVLGVGGLAAVGSVTAAAIYGDRYRRLDDLDRQLTTSEAMAEKRGLHHDGQVARTSAVVLGVGSGVLLIAGILLLDVAARQPRRVSVAPTVTANLLGIELAGRF
jgi:hypothetical protein